MIVPASEDIRCCDLDEEQDRIVQSYQDDFWKGTVTPKTASRIEGKKDDRGVELGLKMTRVLSFEGNQSYPKLRKPVLPNRDVSTEAGSDMTCMGNGINDVSFSSPLGKSPNFVISPYSSQWHGKASTSRSDASRSDVSTTGSDICSFVRHLGLPGKNTSNFTNALNNPNKAVVTIDSTTSEILIANEIACELFGFNNDELVGSRLDCLLNHKTRLQETLAESHLDPNGDVIELSGKVMDAKDSSGLIIPISVWVRKLGTEAPRSLVVMEPVDRIVANIRFDGKGRILNCDEDFTRLLNFASKADVKRSHINSLLPHFVLPHDGIEIPKEVKKQKITGCTKDGKMFPLSINICRYDGSEITDGSGEEEEEGVDAYVGIVWVYTSLSGLITLRPDGTIYSVNEYFARFLLGYTRDELVGQNIVEIIPSFYQDIALLSTSRSDLNRKTDSSLLSVVKESDRTPRYSKSSADSGDGVSTDGTLSHDEGAPTEDIDAKLSVVGYPNETYYHDDSKQFDSRSSGPQFGKTFDCSIVRREDALDEHVEAFDAYETNYIIRESSMEDEQQRQKNELAADGLDSDLSNFSSQLKDMLQLLDDWKSVDDGKISEFSNNPNLNWNSADYVPLEDVSGKLWFPDSRPIGEDSGKEIDGFQTEFLDCILKENGCQEYSKDEFGWDEKCDPLVATGARDSLAEWMEDLEKLNEFPELDKVGFSRIEKMSFCAGDDTERSDERIKNELQSTPGRDLPTFVSGREDSRLNKPTENRIGVGERVDQIPNGVNPEMLSGDGFVHDVASDLVDQMSKEFGRMSVNGPAQNTINPRDDLTNEIDQLDENCLAPRRGGISTDDNVIAAVHASTCRVVDASDGIAVNRDLSTDDGTCQVVIASDGIAVVRDLSTDDGTCWVVDASDGIAVVRDLSTDDGLCRVVNASDGIAVDRDLLTDDGKSTSDRSVGVDHVISYGVILSECVVPTNSVAADEGDKSYDSVTSGHVITNGVTSGYITSDHVVKKDHVITSDHVATNIHVITNGHVVSNDNSITNNTHVVSSDHVITYGHVIRNGPVITNDHDFTDDQVITRDHVITNGHVVTNDHVITSDHVVANNHVITNGHVITSDPVVITPAIEYITYVDDCVEDKPLVPPENILKSVGSLTSKSECADTNSFDLYDMDRHDTISCTNWRDKFKSTSTPAVRWRNIEQYDAVSRSFSDTNPSFERSGVAGDAEIVDGIFQGSCRHRDGNLFDVIFQIKCIHLANGRPVYCVWVSRDPERSTSHSVAFTNLTLASSLTSSHSVCIEVSGYMQEENRPACALEANESDCYEANNSKISNVDQLDASSVSFREDELTAGSSDYLEKYDTLHAIGKGAFGCVKLAQRKQDNMEVVVKFIKISKVRSDCWTSKATSGINLPMEISLLESLSHPCIVKLLDYHQGDFFYQMIMEKHGSGMDLFEFIERAVNSDESLSSYIFRQIVSAVQYLHDMSIVHRDIKDENVIIDERFHIKLIDFGSATFFEEGTLFSLFCGTMEYCSPEVLCGNKYNGPELEMWSLGVTLYTLIMTEAPFTGIENSIKGEFEPLPSTVSLAATHLIKWLLNPNPVHRATIDDVLSHIWTNHPIDITCYEWSVVCPSIASSSYTPCNGTDDRAQIDYYTNHQPIQHLPGLQHSNAALPYQPAMNGLSSRDLMTSSFRKAMSVQ